MKKTLVAAAILASTAFAMPAHAAITITSDSLELGRNGTIHYTPGGLPNGSTSVNAGVGRISLVGTNNGSPVSYLAYCIDIFDYLHPGTFNLAPFSFDPTKMNQIKSLLTNTATSIATAGSSSAQNDTAAAIQMALWEIAFEAGNTNYSVASGNFYMTGTTANALSLASGYLGNINANLWAPNPNYSLMELIPVETANNGNQTQVFLVNTPVPEPAAWALMIAGFGMVGASMRRRQKTALKFA